MNIWIVGASAGIGRELALLYRDQGHNVVVSARNKEALEEICDDKISALPFDVLDFEACQLAFDGVLARLGEIDLFIYNSGIYQPMNCDNFDVDYAKKTVAVNFSSIFHFLPRLVEEKCPHIALTASVAGYFGLPNSMAYGASKAAMINLAQGLYGELKRKNIAISVINPGFVKTRLTDKNDFAMPFIIDAKQAAQIIAKGLARKKFEIHFLKKFTFLMKFLGLLPNFLLLAILKRIK